MRKSGFTLIELIVVMAIISILVLLGVPKYKEYTNQARITKLIVETKELEKASQKYYMKFEDWPRLNETSYTKEQIESFGKKIYDKTGKVVELEEDGNYYDIAYNKLSNYLSKPSSPENYILQNPVGVVYAIEGVTELRKNTLPKEVIEDVLTGKIKQIEVGYNHTVALMSDGTVKVWGLNSSGQLGLGDTENRLLPETIIGLTNVKQIDAGANFTVALLNDGTVKSWGNNQYGQLGVGNKVNQLTPTLIPDLNNVKEIESGHFNSYFIMEEGTIKGCGLNIAGQLGLNDITDRNKPTTIPGLSDVKEMVVGRNHTMALLNNGTIKSSGSNQYGQLGTNTSDLKSFQLIPNLTGVKKLAAGGYHSIALLEDGSVKFWGYNVSYSVAGVENWYIKVPTLVPNLTGVRDLQAGEYALYAVMEDNTLLYLQNLKKVTGYENIKEISIGYYHSVAILNDDTIIAGGRNTEGQLGIGSTINSSIPITVNIE